MRLFIAIQFEEKILDAITDFQDDLKAQGVTGNYTLRENLHITLAFIGEYGNPDDILDAMEQVELFPVEIKLEGVGRFGNLFWVGLSENPELAGYVKRLRRKVSEYGIPYDKKRFTPHITVIRKAEYRNGRIPVMEAPRGCMIATRVSLMRSDRGRHGMIYTEVGAVEA
jgi:2'-5' RNA ligase